MNEWPDEPGARAAADAPSGSGPCGCDPGDSGMVLRRNVVIPNSRGLHARAAAKLVSTAERFSACVNVVRNGESVPACSIMGLMMLGAGQGAEVMIEAEGWDAKEALEAVAGLVEAGFHED